MESADLLGMVTVLLDHEVEFIIIGGVSAVLQGAPVTTFDLDIVHRRSPENIDRFLGALRELDAAFRLHRRDIPPQASHLSGPGHSLLRTRLGPLDALGQVDIVNQDYDGLLPFTREMVLDDRSIRVLKLDTLIEIKRGIGRPKDLAAVAAMEHTLLQTTGRSTDE